MKREEDIRYAATPSAKRYHDVGRLEAQKNGMFLRAFQPVPELPEGANQGPFTLLPGFLDEALIRTRNGAGEEHCLSNVCTHRGMILCDAVGHSKNLRCPYHGRRFSLNGHLEEAPGFEEACDFPRERDNLASLTMHRWGPLRFVQLERTDVFEAWIAPLKERLGFLPLNEFRLDFEGVQTFEMDAHWELYVENYLEGFHVPWVHKSLAAAIDTKDYRLESFPEGSVQIALAKGPSEFDLPSDHPEHGLPVAAWYFHLFPNVMVNVYPWGLSLNVVEPVSCNRTRVRFLPYVWRPELRDAGAGVGLDRVEMEDEAVVEAVHLGLRSRLYPGGRYAPGHEDGLFHFHRLVECKTWE